MNQVEWVDNGPNKSYLLLSLSFLIKWNDYNSMQIHSKRFVCLWTINYVLHIWNALFGLFGCEWPSMQTFTLLPFLDVLLKSVKIILSTLHEKLRAIILFFEWFHWIFTPNCNRSYPCTTEIEFEKMGISTELEVKLENASYDFVENRTLCKATNSKMLNSNIFLN